MPQKVEPKPTMPPKPDGPTPYTQEQKKLRVQLVSASLSSTYGHKDEVKWTVHRALEAANILEAYLDKGQDTKSNVY